MVSERATLKKISFLIRYVAGGRVILVPYTQFQIRGFVTKLF